MKREVEIFSEKKRKTRSDKKRDVKPSISIELKNCLSVLSYITGQPIKSIIEIIFIKSIQSTRVIDYLSSYFIRDYVCRNTFYIGDLDNKYPNEKSKKIRATTRLKQEHYEILATLAYSLDMTPSKALAVTLDAGIKNTNILNSIIRVYLTQELDNTRIKELKTILKFINDNNPYDEKVSWFNLMSLIDDELKTKPDQFKTKITNFLDRYK